MTRKTLDLIKSLLDVRFNPQETMKVLTHNIQIYWSWGVSRKHNLEDRGLLLKVNGHHHKGYVLITLCGNDTYTVHIISTHGNTLNTYKEVYFDDLVEIIDNRIEKIPEYVR